MERSIINNDIRDGMTIRESYVENGGSVERIFNVHRVTAVHHDRTVFTTLNAHGEEVFHATYTGLRTNYRLTVVRPSTEAKEPTGTTAVVYGMHPYQQDISTTFVRLDTKRRPWVIATGYYAGRRLNWKKLCATYIDITVVDPGEPRDVPFFVQRWPEFSRHLRTHVWKDTYDRLWSYNTAANAWVAWNPRSETASEHFLNPIDGPFTRTKPHLPYEMVKP